MLCWPSRSPCRASSRLPGGIRRSARTRALFKVNKRRSATDAIFANSLTSSRLNKRSVFLQENVRIMYIESICYYVVRQQYHCTNFMHTYPPGSDPCPPPKMLDAASPLLGPTEA